jgi:hypothetical protein
MQSFSDYLSAAVDTVLTWDIPESDFAETVNAHACLLAGINPDEILWHYSE